MPRLQITCANKLGDYCKPHERIQSVGGVDYAVGRWKHLEDDAIRYIENRTHSYFLNVGGRAVNIIVATYDNQKYLKSENVGYSPENLLALPDCS